MRVGYVHKLNLNARHISVHGHVVFGEVIGGALTNGLHRLNRERRLVIKAADQHSGAEGKENPKGFDLKNRD
jgi:hypothetical protein